MRAELRRHARRVARIERIRDIAVERGDQDAIERADVLEDHELARHASALEAQGIDIQAEDVDAQIATEEVQQ